MMRLPVKYRFPRRMYKGLAGTQLAIGLLMFLVGIADICLTINGLTSCYSREWEDRMDDDIMMDDMEERQHIDRDEIDWDDDRPKRPRPAEMRGMAESVAYNNCEEQSMMSIPSYYVAGISVGILLIISGSLGVAAARTNVIHRQSGLKTGFLVMNILNTFNCLAMLAVGGAEVWMTSMMGAYSGYNQMRIGCGVMLIMFGFIQFILCIVSASVSCCCSPTDEYVPLMPVMGPPPAHVQWIQQPPMPVIQEEREKIDEAGIRDNQIKEDEKLARTLQEKLFPVEEDKTYLVDNEQTEGAQSTA